MHQTDITGTLKQANFLFPPTRVRVALVPAPLSIWVVITLFAHLRKPDADIFRLALDVAQTPARQVVYIENTPMFVQIAEGLGIRSILHKDCRSTCAKLASFGLQTGEGVIHGTS